MRRKRRFFRSLVADSCFVAGLVAVVVGIAASGYGPLAVTVAGIELVGVGLLMALPDREEDDDDPG